MTDTTLAEPIGLTTPAHQRNDQQRPPEEGIALCLSGGGYRAMVFHVGMLWRLHQTGILSQVKRISCVSGGAITAAQLGMRWRQLDHTGDVGDATFIANVVTPIRRLADKTIIDIPGIVLGAVLPGPIGDHVTAAYREHLFGSATLQDLPADDDGPRIVINATNLQSGALWRFSRPYMRDWRVGEVVNPTVSLATAVGASSAFPPLLSPQVITLNKADFTRNSGADLQFPPYTTRVVLTDGGVYDNLGLETAWKRYKTILVSDAGGRMQPEEAPKHDWVRQSYRVLNMIDNQVRALRKRQVIGSYKGKTRTGAYWGIGTNIANYKLPDALDCPLSRTRALATIATGLERLDPRTQKRLINWGYAVADAALRAHVDGGLKPGTFPYPNVGV